MNVGRFIVHPSVTLDLARRSNIFFQNAEFPGDDVVTSGVLGLKPRLLVDLPLGESKIRWDYSPVYRSYTSNVAATPDTPLSHFFDLEGLYRSPRALTIRVKDHLVHDTVELQELDQGRELVGLIPFRLHEAEVETALGVAARHSVSLTPRWSSGRFNEREEPSFFSYVRHGMELRYDYALDPLSILYGFLAHERSSYERADPIASGEPNDVTRTVGVGVRRTLSQAVAASFYAGYRAMRFEGDLGRDFSGPVFDGGARWQLSDTTHLEVSARRQAYPSFFLNNSFYLGRSAGFRLVQLVGRSAYWQAGATYQNSRYADPLEVAGCGGASPADFCPSLGRRRRDRALQLEIGAGCQVLRTLRLSVGYNSEVRRSNLEQTRNGDIGDPFHYRVRGAFLRIEAGWL